MCMPCKLLLEVLYGCSFWKLIVQAHCFHPLNKLFCFAQGEQGHEFFIISEGRVSIKVDGKVRATYILVHAGC